MASWDTPQRKANHWPIIPIDLRRDDLIVSYNLLRRREGVDAAVVCRSFVGAIVHAWGEANTNETPRLATWLETLLMLAYERECSLVEALQAVRSPDLRELIAKEVRHGVARSTLEDARHLRESEFQDRVESTFSRLNRFLSTQMLRATLCQSGESLDLGSVLDRGSILLANLSVEGTKVADEDAAALGSVLLSDLWTAARRRGKREEGELRPCYVYIDEFQNYVTPTIARGLSEASGFGLHLTLAHQYPSQLPDQNKELGTMVLNAVLANAKNKTVFQLSHPDDVETLSSILFRQSVDPKKVKDEIYTTKVMDHQLTYLPSYSKSQSHGTTEGWQHQVGESTGITQGTSSSRVTLTSRADTIATGTTDGESAEEGAGGDGMSAVTGRARRQQIETDRKLPVHRVEVHDIVCASRWHVIEHFFGQFSVRIEQRDTKPRFDVLKDQIAKERRLSGASLPDDIQVLAAGVQTKPEGLMSAPSTSDSDVRGLIEIM